MPDVNSFHTPCTLNTQLFSDEYEQGSMAKTTYLNIMGVMY